MEAAVSTIMDLTSFLALVPRTLTSTMMEAPVCYFQTIMRVSYLDVPPKGLYFPFFMPEPYCGSGCETES